MSHLDIRRALHDSGIGFGTSGARGLVEQFTEVVCTAYIHAFVEVMRRDFDFDSVALGMDLRPSSPGIAARCAGALAQAGVRVVFCGVLPTPALALYAMERGIPAVMVTGSHIPFDRNGLKFYRPDGEISKHDEQAMLALDGSLPGTGGEPILPPPAPVALDAYARRYLDYFPRDQLAGMRIGLYEHSSAARDVLAQILTGLGAQVVSLGRTDTFVPIDTEAVSTQDAARGRAWAAEHGLDAILSTDGDGDRPLLADESGTWLRGDLLGLLCARALGIMALAVPVSCNTAIEACGMFAEVRRTRIGSPHVIAAMAELAEQHERVAGFEANGGFLLGCRLQSGQATLASLPTRDAILPALAVLVTARRQGRPLSALLADLPARHTASDRLQDFPTTRSQALLAAWTRDLASVPASLGLGTDAPAAVDHTDGLRMTLAGGEIVHLRASGNAPELRCYGEAGDPGLAQALVAKVLRRVESFKEP